MNILEHYIKKVVKIETIEEHDFEDWNGQIQHCPTYYKATFIADCYGSVSELTMNYLTKEELDRDIERGYFFA